MNVIRWELAPYSRTDWIADTEVGRYYVKRMNVGSHRATLNGKHLANEKSALRAKQFCETHYTEVAAHA